MNARVEGTVGGRGSRKCGCSTLLNPWGHHCCCVDSRAMTHHKPAYVGLLEPFVSTKQKRSLISDGKSARLRPQDPLGLGHVLRATRAFKRSVLEAQQLVAQGGGGVSLYSMSLGFSTSRQLFPCPACQKWVPSVAAKCERKPPRRTDSASLTPLAVRPLRPSRGVMQHMHLSPRQLSGSAGERPELWSHPFNGRSCGHTHFSLALLPHSQVDGRI
eukprot:365621-Chlamydomonas_euryale.AAC.12